MSHFDQDTTHHLWGIYVKMYISYHGKYPHISNAIYMKYMYHIYQMLPMCLHTHTHRHTHAHTHIYNIIQKKKKKSLNS